MTSLRLLYIDVTDPDYNTIIVFSNPMMLTVWKDDVSLTIDEMNQMNDASVSGCYTAEANHEEKRAYISKVLTRFREFYGDDCFIPSDVRREINYYETNMPPKFNHTTTKFDSVPFLDVETNEFVFPDHRESASSRIYRSYRVSKNHCFDGDTSVVVIPDQRVINRSI